MTVQLNIFLLLFGAVQGLLFSLFLVRKRLYRSGYIFLLVYLAVLLLQLTLKVMSKGWLMDNWTLLYFYSQYLPLLYGPLAFLFVKYLLNNNPVKPLDLLHLLPALYAFLMLVSDLFNFQIRAGQWLFFNPPVRLVIIIVSLTIYHCLAYLSWSKNNSTLKQFFSSTRHLQLNWLRQFILISMLSGLFVAIALYLLYIKYPLGHEYRYGFVALTLVIYWFSYSALTKPSVFSAIKGSGNDFVPVSSNAGQLKIFFPGPRYTNSGLNNEQIENISMSLDNIVRQEKPYLQPDLTISDLAAKLNCSRHHLSQVLNDHLKKTYYDYINQLRVEEAKQILSNPVHQHQKIATVAYDAGFNSLSTFNDVFRKLTGQTPSQYRKQTIEFSRQKRV